MAVSRSYKKISKHFVKKEHFDCFFIFHSFFKKKHKFLNKLIQNCPNFAQFGSTWLNLAQFGSIWLNFA